MINKGYVYIITYSIYIIYLKSSVYTLSLHSFLYANACVYIQYIYIYIERDSLSSNTGICYNFFEVPFTFLVP